MKNDFNYKWSKIFASKRFGKKDGLYWLYHETGRNKKQINK